MFRKLVEEKVLIRLPEDERRWLGIKEKWLVNVKKARELGYKVEFDGQLEPVEIWL